MVNYQNAKIYKIVCDKPDLVYYGSTCDNLYNRLGLHKSQHKAYVRDKKYEDEGGKKKFYVRSFAVLENNDVDIILVEHYPCNTKEELHARERYYIENFPCVNKNKPGNYVGLGMAEYQRLYQLEYRKKKIDTSASWYNTHKDLCRERAKKYREENKDKIKEYAASKTLCKVCNVEISKAAVTQHNRTKKHKAALAAPVIAAEPVEQAPALVEPV